jgi:hypothetical protein
MKILPSLSPYRSLGMEPLLLQMVSTGSASLWRLQHGLTSTAPPLSPDHQAYGRSDTASVKKALFEARHAFQDALADSLLAASAFVTDRSRQIKTLQDDANSHLSYLAEACGDAIDQGLISSRRIDSATALRQAASPDGDEAHSDDEDVESTPMG